jgi:hypothetical protein
MNYISMTRDTLQFVATAEDCIHTGSRLSWKTDLQFVREQYGSQTTTHFLLKMEPWAFNFHELLVLFGRTAGVLPGGKLEAATSQLFNMPQLRHMRMPTLNWAKICE